MWTAITYSDGNPLRIDVRNKTSAQWQEGPLPKKLSTNVKTLPVTIPSKKLFLSRVNSERWLFWLTVKALKLDAKRPLRGDSSNSKCLQNKWHMWVIFLLWFLNLYENINPQIVNPYDFDECSGKMSVGANSQLHPTWRALTYDWSANSLVMVVWEKFVSSLEFSVQSTTKKNLKDNHCKTICRPVRSGCSS